LTVPHFDWEAPLWLKVKEKCLGKRKGGAKARYGWPSTKRKENKMVKRSQPFVSLLPAVISFPYIPSGIYKESWGDH